MPSHDIPRSMQKIRSHHCSPTAARARIVKLLRRPGINSKESIQPAYVTWWACTITLFLLGSDPRRLFKNSSTELMEEINVKTTTLCCCRFSWLEWLLTISASPWETIERDGPGWLLKLRQMGTQWVPTFFVLHRTRLYCCKLGRQSCRIARLLIFVSGVNPKER